MDDDDFDPFAEVRNIPQGPRSLFPGGVPLAEFDPNTGTYRDERGRDVGEAVDSGIHILIEEDYAVHGLYKGLGPDGKPVDGWSSLFVYRFKFRTVGTNKSRRFKAYRIKVSFETAQENATSTDFAKHPEITRIEPGQAGDIYLVPTTVHITQKTTQQYQAGIDKTVKLQGVLKSESGKEYDELFAADVSTRPDELKRGLGQERRNGQWWKAVGNPKQHEASIPTDFVVAIILKRPNNEKFKALFEVDEGLDTWSSFKRAFNKTTRTWSSEYDPANKKPPQRVPKDFNANNIFDVTLGTQKLYRFCAIHVAEEVGPTTYYSDAGDKKAHGQQQPPDRGGEIQGEVQGEIEGKLEGDDEKEKDKEGGGEEEDALAATEG